MKSIARQPSVTFKHLVTNCTMKLEPLLIWQIIKYPDIVNHNLHLFTITDYSYTHLPLPKI
ncbi:MAG: hypothetical protein K2I44_12075, partial [Muribaculaceae bacterium]|nr:hypothetical protein [Muribaculaceae bacterium]